MKTLSICLIVKNEEAVIERCLRCIYKVADEIIIVDTGSTDSTVSICKKFTNNIYNFKWIDDFSAARNYAFSKATKDYIMWLDADDIITIDNIEKIKKLKKSLINEDIIFLKYLVGFNKYGKCTLEYNRERIFKRAANFKWQGEVHEYIEPKGNIIYQDISIIHSKINQSDSNRNLNIYKKKLQNRKKFTARDLYYFARELYEHNYIEEAKKYFKKFLNSKQGALNDKIQASIILANISDYDEAISILMNTFSYGGFENSLLLCNLGDIYLKKEQWSKAVFYYNQAIKEIPKNTTSFIYNNYYNIIPCTQLLKCYSKMDNISPKEILRIKNILKNFGGFYEKTFSTEDKWWHCPK